ncbi:DUF2206 domain-containing protein (plasmid) [Kitasatospora sp. NBC_00070]|uniref:hypothetical protein n=1 Tax=Kitasatospora sp. NBC_00070 TaxID=2975962 RepID=UPI0032530445
MVVFLGALAVALSVAGAVRLNNGLGNGVSVAALGAVAVLLVLLFARRRICPTGVLELGIYLAAAATLLLVSLRGWYITGHDIQSEYKVFVLALDAGRWRIDSFPTAYNACLSITVLPASITRLTAIPGVYVFKVVLPLLFALTPVLVYRSVRNVAPQLVALLSVVYFMSFPTFFTDMVYLGRQEVAFVLLGCALIVITDRHRRRSARRVMLLVLLMGIVLSHYSTTYVLVATLALSCAADSMWRLARRRSRSRGRIRPAPGFVTWWIVGAVAVAAVVWSGPLTHSGGQVRSTLSAALSDILHPGQSHNGSSDTSYSLFSGVSASPAERLGEYRAQTLRDTAAGRAAGQYLPLDVVDRYPTEALGEQKLPLTAAGKALQDTGLDVATANTFVRTSAAVLLQLLLLTGLAVTILARRSRPFRPTRDQICLAFATLTIIAVLTALPQLSVDYGVLRAFQQGLFVLVPFIAAATLWLLHWTRQALVPLACALAIAFFLDLTGMLPTLLGGYPPQLQLSNAGQYYDIYYTLPAERSASAWAQGEISKHPPYDIASQLQTDTFTYARLQSEIDARSLQDIYPTLIQTDSYVLLGTSTVTEHRATIFFQGDLITYRYPLGLLHTTKNQIYSSEGAAVFQ